MRLVMSRARRVQRTAKLAATDRHLGRAGIHADTAERLAPLVYQGRCDTSNHYAPGCGCGPKFCEWARAYADHYGFTRPPWHEYDGEVWDRSQAAYNRVQKRCEQDPTVVAGSRYKWLTNPVTGPDAP